MNKLAVLGLSLVLMGAGCASQVAEQPAEEETQNAVVFEDGSYVLGGESAITWEGSMKLTNGKHTGTLASNSSMLKIVKGEVAEGKVGVDMTSLASTDPNGGEKLDTHLKSVDFFNVAKYPEASFAFSGLEKVDGLEGATHRVDGVLTIKKTAKEVSFPAMLEVSEGTIHLVASIEIDRTEWDVRYGSNKFFDNLGDAAIKDEMLLGLDLYFVKSGEAMMEESDDKTTMEVPAEGSEDVDEMEVKDDSDDAMEKSDDDDSEGLGVEVNAEAVMEVK